MKTILQIAEEEGAIIGNGVVAQQEGMEPVCPILFTPENLERFAARIRAEQKDERFFAYEFEVWQGDEMCASASGTRDDAFGEVLHYAAQYGEDAPVRIFEVVRKLVTAESISNSDESPESDIDKLTKLT
jgi:hypothetical protein